MADVESERLNKQRDQRHARLQEESTLREAACSFTAHVRAQTVSVFRSRLSGKTPAIMRENAVFKTTFIPAGQLGFVSKISEEVKVLGIEGVHRRQLEA